MRSTLLSFSLQGSFGLPKWFRIITGNVLLIGIIALVLGICYPVLAAFVFDKLGESEKRFNIKKQPKNLEFIFRFHRATPITYGTERLLSEIIKRCNRRSHF